MTVTKMLIHAKACSLVSGTELKKSKDKRRPPVPLTKVSNCGGSLTKITVIDDFDVSSDRSEEVKPAFEMVVGNASPVPGGSDIDSIFSPLKKRKKTENKPQAEKCVFNESEADSCCIINYRFRMKKVPRGILPYCSE